MRVTRKAPLWAVVLAIVGMQASCNVRLGPFLAQLKDGPFANEIGAGGILALAIAGTQEEIGRHEAIGRSARAVHSSADRPLLIDVTESDSESEIIQNILTNLNNVSSPTTRRMVRQVAILDQLSCLPKLICGLNTREPSRRTSVINDYGYLIKYLFERDDEAQEDEEDDEEEDDDLGRDGGSLEKSKMKAKKGSTNDDDDDDTSDSAEEFLNDEPSIVKAIEDDKLEDLAQDELLENEPELLMFAMAEMKDKYKNKKKRIPGINKEYGLDHSDVVGYNKEDYKIIENPLLNTDRATEILKDRSKYTLSSITPTDKDGRWNLGDKKINFDIGDASQEESQGLLGSMMPSFLFKKRKVVVSKPNKDDPFDGDPFFEDFRKRSLSAVQVRNDGDRQTEDIRTEFMVQRRNSRFTNFFQRKSEELHNAADPLRKYEIAEEVGRQTKSSRQCRMLFAKCPYTTDEITTMIDNVKKLVTSQKTVGDKVVTLKKNDASTGTTLSDSISLQPSKSSGSAIEVPLNGGGGGGITQISHQLDNGDKVEITLNIKPKGDKIMQVVQVPISPDPELVKANKTLQEMRRALQAIAKLHNQTELQHVKRQRPQSISVAELLQEQLNERMKQSSPQDSPVNSAESTSDSKSTEDVNLSRPPAAVLPVSIFKINKKDYKEVQLSTKSKPQSSQEDDAGDEEEDDDYDEDEDEDEDEDDDPSGRPSNHMHFYRNQPIPTQPPAKNRFSPFYFNHGLQPAPQNRPRVTPRPQQRLPPRPVNNRNTGPVYLNHGPKAPPRKPRPTADAQAKADEIKRRSSITKSRQPEKSSKNSTTTEKAPESKGGKRRSSLTTTTVRPKASHTRRTSSTPRPKNFNKHSPPKPKATTRRPQPERKRSTSTVATPTTTKKSTETTTQISKRNSPSSEISLTKFYMEATPMAFPLPTPRPDRVTSVRPPLQLPPRPGKYKIHRKKGTNNNQKGQSSETMISKRRG